MQTQQQPFANSNTTKFHENSFVITFQLKHQGLVNISAVGNFPLATCGGKWGRWATCKGNGGQLVVGNLQRGGKLVVGNLQGKWWAFCGGQLAKRWETYGGQLVVGNGEGGQLAACSL